MTQRPSAVRVLRRQFGALITVVSIAVLVPAQVLASSSQEEFNNSKMLQYMNEERAARGIRAVQRDPSLDRAAEAWATKLAAEGRMYHPSSFAGMSLGYRSAAQNLAWHDYTLNAAEAHNMWMASAVHRKNMLDPDFSHAGFAMVCSTDSGRAYVMAAVEFGGDGSPSTSTPPAQPHVAGGESLAGRSVGCDGSSNIPAATAPAATVPPSTTGTVSKTTGPAVTTTRPVTTTPSKRTTTAGRAPAPTTTRKAAGSATTLHRGLAAPAVKPAPEAPASTTTSHPPGGGQDRTAQAAAIGEGPAGPLLLAAGTAGALTLLAVRRRRIRPRHSAGRHRFR